MNIYEQFTLAEHLSDWPENMTYDEVIEAIRTDDKHDVTVSNDFEHLWSEDLADRIEHLKSWVEQIFIARPKGDKTA